MRPRDPNLPPDTPDPRRTLGTYVGVYRPTLLTILGVILYLRVGWIVSNGGLLGAVSIIALTFLITGATALSFSSITTNIRIGSGGAFSLVARSLGLEAGGAIGIPLYLGQALSVAFYMHGLAEAWLHIFPEHPPELVRLVIYATGFVLSLASERVALRSQLLVLIGVSVAVLSMWGGVFVAPELQRPQLLGDFGDAGYWALFAVFFPAGTGIMVGASLSGKLRDPRRNIPRGILGAWATAFAVYLLTAMVMAIVATPEQLGSDDFASVRIAALGPAVLVGLISSCLSAMLGSLVAAPNVLQALAEHKLIPGSRLLARMSRGGTPRWCVALTAVLVGLAMAFGDLDSVAAVITTLFLLTYATVNVVVAVEQALSMISFRPTLSIPIAVPLIGAAGSIFVLVQSEPSLGLLSLAFVVAIYVLLVQRKVDSPWETVRSGMVVALAHRAADMVQRMEGPQYRAWKPDMLVPIIAPSQLAGEASLLEALARPRGSVQVVAITHPNDPNTVEPRLDRAIEELRTDDLIANHIELPATDLIEAVRTSAAVLSRTLLRPNILFVNLRTMKNTDLHKLADIAKAERIGLALLGAHPDAGLGRQKRISVWIRFQNHAGLTSIGRSNVNLLLLLGYQLQRNWNVQLTVLTAVPEGEKETGRSMLRRLREEARLPQETETEAVEDSFATALAARSDTDLHLIGLPDQLEADALASMVQNAGASCLFLRDSGLESAFA